MAAFQPRPIRMAETKRQILTASHRRIVASASRR
jgi:hypothetical protein